MNPQPTGTILQTLDGVDLVVTRRFKAPAADVWESITNPERTARWYGPWRGVAAPGATIELQMAYEEGSPWFQARIEVCEPPRRLVVTQLDDAGDWRMELLLSQTGETTELRLIQHLESSQDVSSIGPGWEYYMDMLVASREGTAQPLFDDYLSQSSHFEAALRAASGT